MCVLCKEPTEGPTQVALYRVRPPLTSPCSHSHRRSEQGVGVVGHVLMRTPFFMNWPKFTYVSNRTPKGSPARFPMSGFLPRGDAFEHSSHAVHGFRPTGRTRTPFQARQMKRPPEKTMTTMLRWFSFVLLEGHGFHGQTIRTPTTIVHAVLTQCLVQGARTQCIPRGIPPPKKNSGSYPV